MGPKTCVYRSFIYYIRIAVAYAQHEYVDDISIIERMKRYSRRRTRTDTSFIFSTLLCVQYPCKRTLFRKVCLLTALR